MTIFFIILSLSCASLYSMDRLPKEQIAEIEGRIQEIESTKRLHPSYFQTACDSNGIDSMNDHIQSQVTIIENILDAHSISHPKKMTAAWLANLQNELSSTKRPSSPQKNAAHNNQCDITGLDKAEVLQALYQNGQNSFYQSNNQTKLTKESFARILETYGYNIDYINNKPLKVNLQGNTLDTFLYNRDNGAGLAQSIIENLRKK